MDREQDKYTQLADRPIPIDLPPLGGWKEIPLKEGRFEPLVALGPFSDNDQIYTHSIYFGEKQDSPYPSDALEGSLMTMFVRKDVAGDLKKAQALLPKGLYLIVFDAYRTLTVQQSLYDVYLDELRSKHPDWTDEQLSAETQKYVSIPSRDPFKPSPHNTGGSVDLAIFTLPDDINKEVQRINTSLSLLGPSDWAISYELEMKKIGLIERNMQLLNFGTKFDHGGIEASLNYFEKLATERTLTEEERKAQRNRRVLYQVMMAADFAPYEDEWWHYNSKKSQMGAKVSGLGHAEYGAMVLSPENDKHEMMRKQHWLGSRRIFSGDLTSKLGDLSSLREPSPQLVAARAGVREVGDIRTTRSPLAAVIKP